MELMEKANQNTGKQK